MKTYRKTGQQRINAPLSEVWEFFSRPENLDAITPDDMKFEILTDVKGVKMYPGILIDYKVSPFPLVRFNWQTEITEIDNQKMFIDEQRKGPYKLWRHQHIFEDRGDHVLMSDVLDYSIGMGFLGDIVNKLVVSRRIDQIFEYRFDMVEDLFNNRSERAHLFV